MNPHALYALHGIRRAPRKESDRFPAAAQTKVTSTIAPGDLVVSKNPGQICFRVVEVRGGKADPWPTLKASSGEWFDGYWFRKTKPGEEKLEIVDWATFTRADAT